MISTLELADKDFKEDNIIIFGKMKYIHNEQKIRNLSRETNKKSNRNSRTEKLIYWIDNNKLEIEKRANGLEDRSMEIIQ